MAEREEMVKGQRALADFGEFALRCDDLQQILTEARNLSGSRDADLIVEYQKHWSFRPVWPLGRNKAHCGRIAIGQTWKQCRSVG